jgi:hypothetical protein
MLWIISDMLQIGTSTSSSKENLYIYIQEMDSKENKNNIFRFFFMMNLDL